MTPDQLAKAIIQGILGGGEGALEGTLAAILPMLWLAVLALHLARPYMLGATGKFSLRLAADIWWVLYVGLRDVLIAVTFLMSFMFLFPDVVLANNLPLGGSLATACLFGVLLVKLVADADDDRRAFQLVSVLLAAGATLFIVPTLVGVQLNALQLGSPWDDIARGLITANNPWLTMALLWISLVAIGLMGLVAVWYNLRAPAAKVTRERHPLLSNPQSPAGGLQPKETHQ
jgi:hypothetical protein